MASGLYLLKRLIICVPALPASYGQKVEPTTGLEPVDLFLTKEALYLLSYVGQPLFSGAGDETRTRDIQLGRLKLYQLSYSRPRQPSTQGNPQNDNPTLKS